MMALSADDVADLRRWFISGAIVVLAHGAIAATVVKWRDEIEPGEPAAAIGIEFAPVPVAPPTPQTDIAPGPEQVMPEASPERPVPQVEDKQRLEETLASGASALDDEALALLRRAQPFPPPPPELSGQRVDLTVPIRFNLK